jgi:hypothetical protein
MQTNPLAGAAPTQQQSIPVTAAFAQSDIDDILNLLRLPANAPLSILAVELFNRESLVIRGDQFAAEIANRPAGISPALLPAGAVQPPSPSKAVNAVNSNAAVATVIRQENEAIDDPLGQELGAQRILRVSPLSPVRRTC